MTKIKNQYDIFKFTRNITHSQPHHTATYSPHAKCVAEAHINWINFNPINRKYYLYILITLSKATWNILHKSNVKRWTTFNVLCKLCKFEYAIRLVGDHAEFKFEYNNIEYNACLVCCSGPDTLFRAGSLYNWSFFTMNLNFGSMPVFLLSLLFEKSRVRFPASQTNVWKKKHCSRIEFSFCSIAFRAT